jgi:hypothetical protein
MRVNRTQKTGLLVGPSLFFPQKARFTLHISVVEWASNPSIGEILYIYIYIFCVTEVFTPFAHNLYKLERTESKNEFESESNSRIPSIL